MLMYVWGEHHVVWMWPLQQGIQWQAESIGRDDSRIDSEAKAMDIQDDGGVH